MMDKQRLRNLTTGYMHTEISHVYQDIEFLTGATGVMTHQLPNAVKAMMPWLLQVVTEPRFFDEQYDPAHTGEIDIQPMTPTEQASMFERFGQLPSPLAGKDVIAVEVPDGD